MMSLLGVKSLSFISPYSFLPFPVCTLSIFLRSSKMEMPNFASLCVSLSGVPCWAYVPLSYLIYRFSRTALALLEAIFVYWVLPLFYTPNLDVYKDRWTVVSGGTDGIGKAYTLELAKRGLRKFLLIGRNDRKLDDVKREIESCFDGARVLTFLFDFTNAVQSEQADRLHRELAKVDIGLAVNSVGVGRELLERFGDRPEADRQLFRVNAVGSAEFISAVLAPMERNGGGQLVVLSSSQGFRPIPLLAAYCATKSLISFIAEAVDREYSSSRVRVQCLTPALVATKMTYYKTGSLFVVTPEQFAREAVNTLGIVRVTSGCFNHEIQMLLRHFFPWAVLKYLIMPIYWRHQKRMIRIQETETNGGMATTDRASAAAAPLNESPRKTHSKIPTMASGNGVRHRG